MTIPDNRTEFERLLDYEIRSSVWAKEISNPRLQTWAAKYFVWKVKRKLARYRESLGWKKRLAELRRLQSQKISCK